MAQLVLNVEALESTAAAADSIELVFLDNSSYEYIGGGDAVNGY